MKVIDLLKGKLLEAATYNPDIQVRPACILWSDKERQWEGIISTLQAELPHLFALGKCDPDRRTGPAIWLRCALARTLPDIELAAGIVPIIYLPGVGRSDLRAVDTCPDHLKPLAELQYRGVIWSQLNAKDWTVLAFLKSDQGGLGLDVAQDADSKHAMLLALPNLLDEDTSLLEEKRLDRDFFNALLTGGDPVKDVLNWLNDDTAFRESRGEHEWKAFVELCRSTLGFNPDKDGHLAGLTNLANRQGAWAGVWSRYCEAPHRFNKIPELLKATNPPPFDLFGTAETFGGWPQWNENQEQQLYSELMGLAKLAPHQARLRIKSLEPKHAERRALVWSELKQSPLAMALKWLATLSEVTAQSLAAGSVADVMARYQQFGWQADDAVLQVLASVERTKDLEAATVAIRAIYMPWAEEAARHLQSQWNPLSDGKLRAAATDNLASKECVLFVDGLRFDCAKRLCEKLAEQKLDVEERPVWAALPSVTGTGKYAVAPVLNGSQVKEDSEGYNFTPITHHLFKNLLNENGWQVIDRKAALTLHNGDFDSSKSAWCEFGDIDHEGHDRGWKLAKHIDLLLEEVSERIQALLQCGWSKVRIVTDHGWLLMPGGLPKTELHASLSDSKWGRCAALKPGAHSDQQLYPWYWNPSVQFALAEGISCYKAGEEYTHGGLSVQECITLELTVSGSRASGSGLSISDVAWKGLRCTAVLDPEMAGLRLDLRTHAGDAGTSVSANPKPFKTGGTASVVVPDEDLEGQEIQVVAIDENDRVMAQCKTKVGG